MPAKWFSSSFMRLVALAAGLALISAHAHADNRFSGDLTVFTLDDTSAGSCNFMDVPRMAEVNYAAMNDAQWAESTMCGRCASVTCIDDRCGENRGRIEIVHILDHCPECKYGDLAVSPSVFRSVTGHDPHRLKASWDFVDCPAQGNIKFCLKEGSDPSWMAIQPTNMVTGVQDFKINGQDTTLLPSGFYYLLDRDSAAPTDLSSVRVSVESVTGEVVEDTVSLTAGSCTEGEVQFTRSS
ncbi:hypothetical protein P43SY_004192 [Pythium insidiosum]|uniref:Expansin-like EG45 domain-containing protein n=1 Tax=Pythium insidiosum TaxID=114742 RepID=A0AAD5LD27_PYTIN|nr:hypothetical protein P43SY_004192 [Pythium insidiosum]